MDHFTDIDCNDQADRIEVDQCEDNPFAGLIYGMALALAFWAVFMLAIYWAVK